MMNDFISRQAIIQLALDGKIISTDRIKCVRDFVNEIPAADVQPVKRGKWIPAGERLPEQGKNVLLCTNGGLVEEGFYFETNEFHTIWKGFVTHGTYWDDEITAWQPLPNPYHAESEDK